MNKQSILASAQKVFSIEAASVAKLSKQLNDDFHQAVVAVLECKGRVVVCGMGKSGIIGKKISATLASTGTPSFFMHPAEAYHGDLGMVTSEDIFLGISNSGETEELIRLIPVLKRNANLLIGMSGIPSSTLAANADFFLNIHVDQEACPLRLAPTSSTTATLAMGDALAVALMEARGFQPEDFALFHPGGSLGRKLLTRVRDVMRKDALPVVSKEADFQELILTMTEGKLGLALVMHEGKLEGVVTDGDLRRAWTKFGSNKEININDIMTSSPKTVSPEMMLVDAEKLLIQYKITSLIVVDDDTPIGILQLYAIGQS